MSRYEILNWIEQQKFDELGAILLTRKEVAALRQGYYREEDLQLCLSPGLLAAVPWESARLPEGAPDLVEQYFRSISRTTSQNFGFRETVKWSQIAGGMLSGQKIVADGIYGPQLRAVLTNLQKKWGVSTTDGDLDQATMVAMVEALSKQSHPPPRVAIIQPSQEEMMQTTRERRVEPSFLFQKSGFLCHTFDPSWEQLRELIGFTPQIIHLITTMEESSRGGELGIRLGRQDYVTASRLNQLLKELPGQQMRPLIILNILRPANSVELWRQVALRNLFATELFHWENTGGIIALGLLEGMFQDDVLESIIAGLAAGKSYGDILARHPLRADLRGVANTVLWSADPRVSLLPPGEERPI